ncbi:hypothetical protein LSTR_LSTR008563 [Laodelphax striatellus]|uniref:DUF19 domain-containing protein n=1 Tax=Laodelphax striatellus TaxID=195883 RepID=A0A482WV87_LAOST|nr:hypothetical protein LSTR_LSTR008563 [Laodelphax striatellus]
MNDFGLKVLLLTSTVFLEGVVCQSDDYADGCLPQLADRCFTGLMALIPCHLQTSHGCTNDQRTEIDAFCNGINDALSCSSDIIDSDCSVAEGRKTFDNWLKGLDAVRAFFCSQNNQSMTVIGQNAHCWDLRTFIECVNKRAQIDHVVKLLQSMLDKNECIFLVGTTSECNALAIVTDNKGPYCSASQSMEVMGEAIHTFFTNAKCQWEPQRCGLPSSANKVHMSFGMYLIILLTTEAVFHAVRRFH